MKRFYRKLQKLSGSLFVSLPKTWTNNFNLEKNSTVSIDIRSDGCLIINPRTKEEESIVEEIILTATKSTPRAIVENSLLGVERIIVISDIIIEKDIIDDIYRFIDALPNTEIIEETPQRIEIQNFDIENIPTQKLIKRLLYLARDMFENVREDQQSKLKSNYAQLRKFYYIIVTHIRKFLRTGLYISEDSDFTPLEAMDYRMFCQKIEKIGEVLINFQLNKEVMDFFQNIETYFTEIMDAFLKKDKDTAYDLWFKRDKIIQKSKNIMERLDSKNVEKIKDLIMIAHNCRDMTTLI